MGGKPVPDNCTVCEPVPASSMIVSTAVCGEVSGGLKVTDTLQFLPGLRLLFLHDFLIANALDDTVSPEIFKIAPVFFLPSFLSVSDFGLLVFPTLVVAGKASPVPLMEMTGVGVGVGVRVVVAVCVAVAVAVGVGPPVDVEAAVLVGVAVAVDVALGVPVGVAVTVALAVAVGVDAVEVAVGVAFAVGVVARGLSYHRDAVGTRKIGGD